MNSEKLINEIKTSILRWYPFEEGSRIVYVGEEDAISEMLQNRFASNVEVVPLNEKLKGIFDYIVCIKYCEQLEDMSLFFGGLKTHLKPTGKLLVGMNNRLGIKYWCGDRDPYTGRNFDGIEDYSRAYIDPNDNFVGRAYDKVQLDKILSIAGFDNKKFYSVFSDLENASFLFADEYIPSEELGIRIFPTYNSPETVFLEEEKLYTELLDNGLFHKMANAYLIECSLDGDHSDALQITSSMDRGHDNAMITIVHDNETVTKQAAFPEGIKKLEFLNENIKRIEERGVSVVRGDLKDGIYTMPFIKAETGAVYFDDLLKHNPEMFLIKLDEFIEEIKKASGVSIGIYEVPASKNETEEQRNKRLNRKKEPWEMEEVQLLDRAMLDMVPLNSFYLDGKFVFFDQEFCLENYPLKALIFRVIGYIYNKSPQYQRIIPKETIYSRYGIDINNTQYVHYLYKVSHSWLTELRKENELLDYLCKIRKNHLSVNTNRQRINFPPEDYRLIFEDIFENADSKKIILFGSGIYARRFLAIYGKDYPVYKVVDNNEKRWGEKLYPEGYDTGGVEISSPECFKMLSSDEYKVIICIKSYSSVIKQLDIMGIKGYSIFDPSKAYPVKRHPLTKESARKLDESSVKDGGKKYHIGYIAGVFDLYHIGHLNMFRRAKELCDYLIVGVVSDEGVLHNKKTEPFVPFEERIEMVKSCRYVDEVFEIPYMFGGTEDAWRLHRFDVQFSGTDYLDDPGFKKYKAFLEKHGATMEFFPYTQSTSSTKIKELIEKKLL